MTLKNIEVDFSTLNNKFTVLLSAPESTATISLNNVIFSQTTKLPVSVSFNLVNAKSGSVTMEAVSLSNLHFENGFAPYDI